MITKSERASITCYTILRKDVESFADSGLSLLSQALVMFAMVQYALYCIEPDFRTLDPTISESQLALCKCCFAMVRSRVDAYVEKIKANQANGKLGGRPQKQKALASASKRMPEKTQKNPTKPNETHEECEEKEEAEKKGAVTHDDPQPGGKHAHAFKRNKTKGWFDPANPGGEDDEAWRTSEQARRAVAQRLIDFERRNQLHDQTQRTDAETVIGANLFSVVEEALSLGFAPTQLMEIAQKCKLTWEWELAIKALVLTEYGGTAIYPDWAVEVAEFRQELEDTLGRNIDV